MNLISKQRSNFLNLLIPYTEETVVFVTITGSTLFIITASGAVAQG